MDPLEGTTRLFLLTDGAGGNQELDDLHVADFNEAEGRLQSQLRGAVSPLLVVLRIPFALRSSAQESPSGLAKHLKEAL